MSQAKKEMASRAISLTEVKGEVEPALARRVNDESEEKFADILNTQAVQELIRVWQSAQAQAAEFAREEHKRRHELGLQQLDAQKTTAERSHQLATRRLEADVVGRKHLMVVIGVVSAGLAALFIYYRDNPDVAMKVMGYVATIFGALGIGYGIKNRGS